MKSLDRKFPVRVSLVAVNAVLYVFTVWAVTHWEANTSEIFDGLVATCGVIAVAVTGDTWRPSGTVKPDASE